MEYMTSTDTEPIHDFLYYFKKKGHLTYILIVVVSYFLGWFYDIVLGLKLPGTPLNFLLIVVYSATAIMLILSIIYRLKGKISNEMAQVGVILTLPAILFVLYIIIIASALSEG